MRICPMCGRPISDQKLPKRVCAKCGLQIGKSHKWEFNEHGRAQHRVCEDPYSYRIEERPVPTVRQERLEVEVR